MRLIFLSGEGKSSRRRTERRASKEERLVPSKESRKVSNVDVNSLNKDGLKLFTANVVTTDMADFMQHVEDKEPEIIALTEIKPKHSSTSLTAAELTIERFHPPFQNMDKYGRGVCIYVALQFHVADFKCTSVQHFQECVWITVSLGHNQKVLFRCIYRSPSSNVEKKEEI